MSRRFWAAVAVGAVVGGGVAAGFGPYVRGRLLDFGCGDGQFVNLISSHCTSCCGVDVSCTAIAAAEEVGEAAFTIDRPGVVLTGGRAAVGRDLAPLRLGEGEGVGLGCGQGLEGCLGGGLG